MISSKIWKIGAGGTSKSTQNVLSSSVLNHFVPFLKLPDINLNIDNITGENITIELFQKFAYYLCHMSEKKNKKETAEPEYLSLGTAMNYLSSVNTWLNDCFSLAEIWKGEEWYATIHYELDCSITHRCSICQMNSMATLRTLSRNWLNLSLISYL